MAGACFGNIVLEGVSLAFRNEVYRMVKEVAIERGFGRQFRIGGEPCQDEPQDTSDSEGEESGSESQSMSGEVPERPEEKDEVDASQDEDMSEWRRDITQ
jgi:hypothetical protein